MDRVPRGKYLAERHRWLAASSRCYTIGLQSKCSLHRRQCRSGLALGSSSGDFVYGVVVKVRYPNAGAVEEHAPGVFVYRVGVLNDAEPMPQPHHRIVEKI